jgi:inosose dehydratase
MFAGLDNRYIGYAPDTGHIANGDMDPLEIIRMSRSIVKHVHFKDISAEKRWMAMGEGVLDHVSIVQYLKNNNYSGWIRVEEESVEAELDPDQVTLQNGKYLAEHLIGI